MESSLKVFERLDIELLYDLEILFIDIYLKRWIYVYIKVYICMFIVVFKIKKNCL